MQALIASFWNSTFLPHGYCLQWNPDLLWTLAISDTLIALAYFSIPFALWYFAKHRPDIRQRWLFVLFGLFIISCGITHLLDVLNLWRPDYWLSAASRIITAVLSVITAVVLWRIMPEALRAPSMQQLEQAGQALEQANAELEQRVAQRTRALENANALLQESEARFRSLANAAPVLIWLAGPDGLCSWFN